jgi:hypothetical protein
VSRVQLSAAPTVLGIPIVAVPSPSGLDYVLVQTGDMAVAPSAL